MPVDQPKMGPCLSDFTKRGIVRPGLLKTGEGSERMKLARLKSRTEDSL